MTSTPAQTSPYKGYAKRFAGLNFGLNLADLFKEDEEGTGTLEGLVPQMKYTSHLKGRSPSTLTYSQAGEPARTAEFSLVPEGLAAGSISNIFSPTNTQTQQKEELEKPEEKKFQGYIGSAGVSDIGGQGFGLKDLTAALEAGYSKESIKDWVESQRNNLYNIGPGAQEALGVKGYVSTAPGVFDYTKYGASGFGLKDVEALRSQGVSDDTLKRLAANAPMVGGGAAAALGYTPTTQQRTESVAQSYDPASAGGAGFGLKDVEALRSQGVSESQMRAIAQRSPMIGEGARKLLGL